MRTFGACLLVASACMVASCRCGSRDVKRLPDAAQPTASWQLGNHCTKCLSALELEASLRHGDFRVDAARVTAQGTSKPRKVRLVVPQGYAYFVKWKPAPASGDESNNSPRRELAAYALQKLFLPPDRYVVPPTVMRCLRLDEAGSKLGATGFRTWDCSLGVLSYWIEDTTELLDAHIRDANPALMGHVSDLNILTFLAGHRDSVGLNFLLHRASKRVFSVDNGMTFGAWEYNPIRLWTSDWSEVRVPGLRRNAVAKLRRLQRDDFDVLAVVAQLEERDGVLVPVDPAPPMDPESGVRFTDRVVQFGLTTKEIDEVHQRAGELLNRVDDGSVALLPD
ncbi:MAG: hypothetical protein ACOC1F_13715 [Myxococcota bacterium]